MSTVNDTENTENTEHTEHTERPERSADPEDLERSGVEDGATDGEQPESEVTSLYVRRGRTPTLGFWVALALIVPAVAALVAAPFFGFGDISSVLNFMLVAAVFVGLPLAGIAALVDSMRHRGEKRRRR